ncbi:MULTISPECIES: hypothetical protein [unclassified Bradyrhizobium]|uniref:hypothetical protein n=1 Tax=unclassified Bradyrhizobium TaxID=2631580 RepID=UPI0029166DDD|nr:MULTISPECIES: hypothetical protein [unclassified Bradyrhizobium]
MDQALSATFSYNVLDCSPDGWARVEFSHDTLGSLIKSLVFIPLNHSAEEQRGAIVMQFPAQAFHSRYLAQLAREGKHLTPASPEGRFTYRIDKPMEDPVGLPLETHKV